MKKPGRKGCYVHPEFGRSHNEESAGAALEAIEVFRRETGLVPDDGLDTAITDLIGDLAHLCDREGLDMADLIRQARNHYAAETPRFCGRQFITEA